MVSVLLDVTMFKSLIGVLESYKHAQHITMKKHELMKDMPIPPWKHLCSMLNQALADAKQLRDGSPSDRVLLVRCRP